MAKKHKEKRVPTHDTVRPAGRRSQSLLLAAVVVAVVAAAGWWFWNRPAQPTSNVVLFVLDTVRRDALGCYANRPDLTPRIDAVADEAVRFEHAVSTSGWTVPAVASLMTGAWPTVHGSSGKGISITPMRLELPVAAEIFKKAGYATVGYGNSSFVSPALGVDRGFDVFDHNYGVNWDARRADATITAAISELNKRRDKSTFYFIHLFDPHLHYDPPGEYATMYTAGRNDPPPPLSLEAVKMLQLGEDAEEPPAVEDQRYVRGVYDGEVSFMDAHIGRFIDELKALGLYESTTIIFVADHGEEFWDHGGFEHGHTLYDELVMVPLILKFPSDVLPSARVVQPQVRLIDVMPTVFDALDIEVPESFAGESLMPVIRGGSSKDLMAFCESTLYGAPQIAVRGAQYKYILAFNEEGGAVGALYDWRNDPGETVNLEEDMPRVASRMRTDLMEWFQRNRHIASDMSVVKPIDMNPERLKRLRSLGYIR